MASLKFSNVKYYRGGGKKVKRLRFNQNYTIFIFLNSQKWLLEKDDEWLINNLSIITNNRILPSSTTKIKRTL